MPTCSSERVDELLLQGSEGHIGPLWHIEDVMRQAVPSGASRLVDPALSEGPQPSQDSEQAALARPIGAGDQQVGSSRHTEVEVPDQSCIRWGDHHCIFKGNGIL